MLCDVWIASCSSAGVKGWLYFSELCPSLFFGIILSLSRIERHPCEHFKQILYVIYFEVALRVIAKALHSPRMYLMVQGV